MSETKYGDAFITLRFEFVDCGEPDKLHAIFDCAIKNGAKPLKIPHPLNIHQRVLNGLDRDGRFEKTYIDYPGICKRPARVFKLKEIQEIGTAHSTAEKERIACLENQ